MDKFDIQKLRELPIESVSERLGLRVNRHKATCPFHDDQHPSLYFNVARNTYRCYACGAHGGVLDLAMHELNKPFYETCQWLANENNIILSETKTMDSTSSPQVLKTKTEGKPFDASRLQRFFDRPYINSDAFRFLYQERFIDPRVVRWCKLTSWTDKDGISWLQIPYFDQEWRLTGVQWRRLTKSEKLPRFRFPSGSQCHIYNLPVLKMLKPGEPLYITEGCSDCWSMLSSGHKAIAIPSATLLKPDDLKPLETIALQLETPLELHTFPDKDQAGDKLYRQLCLVANSIGCCIVKHDLPDGCKDYSDYYQKLKSSTQ